MGQRRHTRRRKNTTTGRVRGGQREKRSCGGIPYGWRDGEFGIILGLESGHWLPLKGGRKKGESREETALREIYEESCGLISLRSISLDHRFSSRYKKYAIGLTPVAVEELLADFPTRLMAETRDDFREKQALKFFPLQGLLECPEIHNLSKASIRYFWDELCCLQQATVVEKSNIVWADELLGAVRPLGTRRGQARTDASKMLRLVKRSPYGRGAGRSATRSILATSDRASARWR
jgi:hypothetical protein